MHAEPRSARGEFSRGDSERTRAFGGAQGSTARQRASWPPASACSSARTASSAGYSSRAECTEETFRSRRAQRAAAALGLALVTPDTSPRAARFPGDDASWDFGQGAGFYLDATESPWSSAYRMHRYVTEDLRRVVEAGFPVLADRRGIFGHSMGGHGALTLRCATPGSPRFGVRHHSRAERGAVGKRRSRILVDDRQEWRGWETRADRRRSRGVGDPRRSGTETLLKRSSPPGACGIVRRRGTVADLRPGRLRHGYFLIATFVADHLRHHAQARVRRRAERGIPGVPRCRDPALEQRGVVACVSASAEALAACPLRGGPGGGEGRLYSAIACGPERRSTSR